MTLIILGLDGLDYDLVEKLNLENLKQKQYSRLKVPINKNTKCPCSPEVWASFLCGERIKTEFEGRKHTWLLRILVPLKQHFPFISLGIGRKTIGGIVGFPELKRETWIDNKNVKEIGVPYYSYTGEAFQYSKELSEDKNLDRYRKRIYQLFLEKTNKVIFEVKNIFSSENDYSVVFAYIHFPDLFQHAWFTRREKIFEYYFEILNFFNTVKKIVGNNYLLVISDHGFDFKKNMHSNYGFISSNKELDIPTNIIELGKYVKNIVEEIK